MIPDGGDHVPSDFLAMRIPEPPEPVIQRPFLMQVNTAIPAAFWMIRFGILFIIFVGVVGSSLLSGEEGVSGFRGAKYPSPLRSVSHISSREKRYEGLHD
jgi:hypothetical protein